MNCERTCAYRFRDIDQAAMETAWHTLLTVLHPLTGSPEVVLDPAAGLGEFIRSSPAREK